MLALLLARQGIKVTLLEKHADFQRDFRGDTIHPSTLEILDALGLANRLLQLPLTKLARMEATTPTETFTFAAFSMLKTSYPYLITMPQVTFLNFLIEEARSFPTFLLRMQATMTDLLEEEGSICGVRYQGTKGIQEVQARPTVGADGRFSRTRQLSGLPFKKTSPPIDILWFRLPRRVGEQLPSAYMGDGYHLTTLERNEEWQIGYVITKGSYKELRTLGINALQELIVEALPHFADRVSTLSDWKHVSLLSVELGRLARCYKPGLLLIGDAAHIMSPVGGVGINSAIGEAVVAANLLWRPLKEGRIGSRDLAKVQRQREWPIKVMMEAEKMITGGIHNQLQSREAASPHAHLLALTRLPLFSTLMGRAIGFGLRRVQVDPSLRAVARPSFV